MHDLFKGTVIFYVSILAKAAMLTKHSYREHFKCFLMKGNGHFSLKKVGLCQRTHLYSDFHPKGMHSSEHRYRLKNYWCTCCCGRRKCYLCRELQERRSLLLRTHPGLLTLPPSMSTLCTRDAVRQGPVLSEMVWGKHFLLQLGAKRHF